jgi:transcriptional regulator of acetoin/glycerol metabolism
VVHSALAGAHQQVHLTFRNRNLVVCGYPVVDPDGRVLSALLVVRPMPPHDRALRNRLSTLVSSV